MRDLDIIFSITIVVDKGFALAGRHPRSVIYPVLPIEPRVLPIEPRVLPFEPRVLPRADISLALQAVGCKRPIPISV